MLMNVLASGVLFLFIGPFKHVSSGETKETGQVKSTQNVYIAVNDTLELNCSVNGTIYKDIHPTQLAWKHNNKWVLNFNHIVKNNTLQLRKNHTHYEDAGVYECGLFNNSMFQSAQRITVVVGEKPSRISEHQFTVKVYGKPVQKVTVKWPALQKNATYELIVGRIPVEDIPSYICQFHNGSQCKRTARYQHEILSCRMGMDVLGKLFLWNELSGQCSGSLQMHCDTLCAKVIVKNAFGTSESDQVHWNLESVALCPPLRNLRVSLGANITVIWQRPLLVEEGFSYSYNVTYVATSILTGKLLRSRSIDQRTSSCSECSVSVKERIVPFARYSVTASCSFYMNEKGEAGPAVHTEVTSKEAAPSEAPRFCEVKSRSRHDALVSWEVPSIDTWNGIPRKFLVYYDNHSIVVNTSLDALYNRLATPEIVLTNLDPHKNYSVMVAMCTGAGCRNFSTPCLIPVMFTNNDSSVEVVTGPGETKGIGVTTWITIAFGVIFGLSLVVFIAYSIKRKRSRRKPRYPLIEVLGPLNGGIHHYENSLDDRPSFCEDVQYYDSIHITADRPLLPAPVTKI